MKAENMPFRKAVEAVAGIVPITVPPRQEAKPPKTLILPPKAGISLRLYDYLCNKRGIDSGIVNALMQKGMLYEDKRRNVVFVGYDEQGNTTISSMANKMWNWIAMSLYTVNLWDDREETYRVFTNQD